MLSSSLCRLSPPGRVLPLIKQVTERFRLCSCQNYMNKYVHALCRSSISSSSTTGFMGREMF